MTLHFVTQEKSEGLLEIIAQAIAGGITHVQLRQKKQDKLALFTLGKAIQQLTTPKKIPLIINDHIDLALALVADGVHLGQTDLPVSVARQLLGPKKIIGLSIQNSTQVTSADNQAADYYGVGPVFPSSTKTDVEAIGLPMLKKIISVADKPCIAIGGITQHNLKSVIDCGVAGIAIVSGICDAENPKAATESYLKILK